MFWSILLCKEMSGFLLLQFWPTPACKALDLRKCLIFWPLNHPHHHWHNEHWHHHRCHHEHHWNNCHIFGIEIMITIIIISIADKNAGSFFCFTEQDLVLTAVAAKPLIRKGSRDHLLIFFARCHHWIILKSFWHPHRHHWIFLKYFWHPHCHHLIFDCHHCHQHFVTIITRTADHGIIFWSLFGRCHFHH